MSEDASPTVEPDLGAELGVESGASATVVTTEAVPEQPDDILSSSHMTEDTSHVTASDAASPNTSDLVVADSALSEERDLVPDLPATGSSSPFLGKGKRSRSETESKGSKVPLISFKARKRSQTLQEVGAAKEKEDQEEVS